MIYIVTKGMSKSYVVKYVVLKSTLFSGLAEKLFSSESSLTLKTQPFGSVFGVQLGLRQTHALINTNWITLSSSLLVFGEVIVSTNECPCLPKVRVEYQKLSRRLVEFLVCNSIN